MKSKKWLLIIVLVVFFINIAFYGIIRLGKIDELVKEKITAALSESLQAKVEIGDFTFNDRNLKVIDFNITKSELYQVNIDQIYIDYNLLKLLFSRFKNLEAIKHIKIHNPVIALEIAPSEEKSDSSFEIPDISKFFKLLHIYNGTVAISYNADKFTAKTELKDISLSIDNRTKTSIKFNCKADQGDLTANLKLDKDKLETAEFSLQNYFPNKLEIPLAEDLVSKLNLQVIYKEDKLDFNGKIFASKFSILDRAAQLDSLVFAGDDQLIGFTTSGLRFDGNELFLNGNLEQIFSTERSVTAAAEFKNIKLKKYISAIEKGSVSLEAEIMGELTNPIIEAEINSDLLRTASQDFEEIEVKLDYYDQAVLLDLINCSWEGNSLTGSGKYNSRDGFIFNVGADDVEWTQKNLKLAADLNADIEFENSLTIDAQLSELAFESDKLKLDNINISASYQNERMQMLLTRSQNDIEIFGEGTIHNFTADLQLKRLNLNKMGFEGKQLPVITGNVELKSDPEEIILDSKLRAYGKNFGELDGLFETKLHLDKIADSSYLSLKSSDARYNYEPIKIELEADGSLDSLATSKFLINEKLEIDNWIKLKPKLEYAFTVKGEKIKLKNIFKYFTDYYTKENIFGTTSFDLYYDNLQKGKLKGNCKIENFKLNQSPPINSTVKFNGDLAKIEIENISVNSGEQALFTVNGTTSLQPHFEMELAGSSEMIDLEKLFQDKKIAGIISGNFRLKKGENSNQLTLNYEAENIKIDKLLADKIELSATQFDRLLQVDSLKVLTSKYCNLSAQGAIGYNILTRTAFPDTNKLNLEMNGNALRLLSKMSSLIRRGRSEFELDLQLGIEESGLSFPNGRISLQNGRFEIKEQPQKVDDLDIDIAIDNNEMQIEKFRAKLGDGKLYLENMITNNKRDFVLGMLNLGTFQLRTNSSGILINVLKFSPANSYVKAVISGRNGKSLLVNGPFEDIQITGDILLSNGSVIYPPNTENLMKLFNVVREKKEKSEPLDLPLSFDLMISFSENIRYTTFPADIELNPNCFIHLIYKEGAFSIPSGLFNAENGSVDMFGTKLTLDNLQIQMNQFEKGANIYGTFYKQASDGTIITLRVYNDNEGKLKFDLLSDNPGDTITDILAKLRYNRSIDEISQGQKETLMQDEFIQIAGIGLESAVLSPLISPVENWIRRQLRLDYFHLQTGFVQNIFSSYSSQTEGYQEEQSRGIDQFTSDVFLNNLSINMGKYLTNQVFLDYKARFEKPIDISFEASLGVFHEFALRYDLPYKFNISYRFHILPFDQEDSHEIGLEKSIQFGNFVRLFNK